MATAQMDAVIRHLRRAVSRQDGVGRTDGQLLASFIDQKDESAFEDLVRRHGPMVFGVCRRVVGNHHDAEDAFQATFLVLARKASSVEPRERLANWLHGVALRTAMKAKGMSAKRRGRERQVAEMPEPEAPRQDQWLDLQPLLDKELNGLPENYRLPILLCDLEGKTIKEAAGQLGWPQGTLAGRLARGRKLLARRLANRGVMLPAGSLAAIVSQNAVSAAVPASLMSSTLKSAAGIAAGRASAAGVVPARVAILMEGVLKAMLLSKLKTATAGLLVVALAIVGIGAGGLFHRTQAGQPPKVAEKEAVADGDNELRFPVAPPPLQAVATVVKYAGGVKEGSKAKDLLSVTVRSEDRPDNPPPVVKQEGIKGVASSRTSLHDLNDVQAFDTKGKRIERKNLLDLLRKTTAVLVSADGRPVDPFYLQLVKDGTVVLILGPAPEDAEKPKEEPEDGKPSEAQGRLPPQAAPPPRVADHREYVIRSRLLEAGADWPKEILHLPKLTLDDGQFAPSHITDASLTSKTGLRIKIGTFFDVQVKRLGENKVRLFCSFQRNEIEKFSESETRVLGNSVHARQDVELRKPVKLVLQKDARGSAQRWVEITVDEKMIVDEQPAPPPAGRRPR